MSDKKPTQGERLTAVEVELKHVCKDVERMEGEMKETHMAVIEIRELLSDHSLSHRIAVHLANLGKDRNARRRMTLAVVCTVVTVGSLIVAVVSMAARL